MNNIAICISTYQRLEGLDTLLNGLQRLEFKQVPVPAVTVIVVDNDAAGVAQAACEARRSTFRWRLKTAIEPQRGISYARNTSVALVPEDTDFIVFIDDDEMPSPAWLENLLLTQHNYQADVVFGPSLPHFCGTPAPWIRRGGFFEPQRRPTGHPIEVAYTSNVLVKAVLLKACDRPFAERFALSGGEDSYLFRSFHHQGHQLVWADEAWVYESIPESRQTAPWLLQRHYRSCLTYSLWEQDCHGAGAKAKALMKGSASVAWGLLSLFPALIQGRAAQVQALIRIARGAGCWASLLGLTYSEYKVIH